MNEGEIIALLGLGTFALLATRILIRSRSERRKRELEHVERMKAFEVGRTYPEAMKNSLLALPSSTIPYLIAMAIGALVPIATFACALLATLIGGFHNDVWIATGFVGIASVISAATLAGTVFQKSHSNGYSEHSGSLFDSKPHVDEDAYDVVSARG
jgi:hypothetical protein